MIKSCLILTAIVLVSTLSVACVGSELSELNVADMSFADDSHGWLAVMEPSPAIFKTTDAGQSWKQITVEWSNNSDDCEGGGTVHQDRALPENRTLHPKADRNSRFQTLHIAELVTFRRVTLPEKPWLLLM
jgi:hypothetical protein